jgi:hypothetical protein
MKKKLIKALYYLKEGEAISLDNDTFLTGLLDGSDKIYGFGRLNNLLVVLNGSSNYSIDYLTGDDLNYIFKHSLIYDNIVGRIYDIKNLEEI